MHNQEHSIERVRAIVDHLLQTMCGLASDEFQRVLDIPIRVLWDSPEHNRYGDFFGIPLNKARGGESIASDIIIYAHPLLQQFGHDEELFQRMVKKTLMHEIGHYLGLDHDELRERGWN